MIPTKKPQHEPITLLPTGGFYWLGGFLRLQGDEIHVLKDDGKVVAYTRAELISGFDDLKARDATIAELQKQIAAREPAHLLGELHADMLKRAQESDDLRHQGMVGPLFAERATAYRACAAEVVRLFGQEVGKLPAPTAPKPVAVNPAVAAAARQ